MTEIHPLTPDRLPHLSAYFDGPAVADNPRWGWRYCQFLYVDHSTVKWPERSAQANRLAPPPQACAARA